METDKTDQMIINELKKSTWKPDSIRKIAAKLGIPKSTVHDRYNKIKKKYEITTQFKPKKQ